MKTCKQVSKGGMKMKTSNEVSKFKLIKGHGKCLYCKHWKNEIYMFRVKECYCCYKCYIHFKEKERRNR